MWQRGTSTATLVNRIHYRNNRNVLISQIPGNREEQRVDLFSWWTTNSEGPNTSPRSTSGASPGRQRLFFSAQTTQRSASPEESSMLSVALLSLSKLSVWSPVHFVLVAAPEKRQERSCSFFTPTARSFIGEILLMDKIKKTFGWRIKILLKLITFTSEQQIEWC